MDWNSCSYMLHVSQVVSLVQYSTVVAKFLLARLLDVKKQAVPCPLMSRCAETLCISLPRQAWAGLSRNGDPRCAVDTSLKWGSETSQIFKSWTIIREGFSSLICNVGMLDREVYTFLNRELKISPPPPH